MASALAGQPLGAIGGEVRWQKPDYQDAADRYDPAIGGSGSGVTVAAA